MSLYNTRECVLLLFQMVSRGLTTNLHAKMCSGLFELTAFHKQRKIAVIHNQSSLKQVINYSIAEKLYLV